jgi:hypothetical protein
MKSRSNWVKSYQEGRHQEAYQDQQQQARHQDEQDRKSHHDAKARHNPRGSSQGDWLAIDIDAGSCEKSKPQIEGR